ncbi:50S ribosomal protein L6 [Sulfuracidifex metallicus]|uniref:Large ribosomal subunit protein uL6 n=1 Tax=Sulfuracidifex metallicus DSM 6482 = JCM 9184 TaxID=523847 RepID=A0A6A9QIP7_SULME|nr:50S ribosomal protein L6 [Sulfuracidifex metallicus]MUN28544.1 50S ribosomal protein L6 [Sulfuracidifex metallicus DSM 6482 = JCM 9184]WOE50918.1 50S ribosomal protein L6 [Sulfuracidifex metallicus DSM 6482 = JCM 9184]
MQSIVVKEEIEIPSGVEVKIDGKKITVNGKKGQIERDFSFAKEIEISLDANKVILMSTFLNRKEKALIYSVKRHILNMIEGVTKGYRYSLKIISTHFPMSVKVVGDEVQITNLIGEKDIRRVKIYPGVKVTVKGEDITVEGIDLEKVSHVAANIETQSKIRGFDKRVFSDGIFLYKKEVLS